ncbi:MAG: hypothetical protein M5U19_10255 [Microthrixaceae bacterium]|nr:hypothetical protein [Microthrixaceae bacterium]
MFAISIDGFEDLPGSGGDAGVRAMVELAGRLSRFVRSNDLLAVLAPGGLRPGRRRCGTDRRRDRPGAHPWGVAMPIEVEGESLSLPVTVGVAHFAEATSARELVALAERDLRVGRDG